LITNAINELNAFINQVQAALRANKISQATADILIALIATATDIIAMLSTAPCSVVHIASLKG